MKTPKTAQVKARVEGQKKQDLSLLAQIRKLDVSDLIREAIDDLLAKQLTHVPMLRR